jgi:hypothetical protein
MSRVSFKLPDFAGPDGVKYTDIEVVVESDADVRETSKLTSVVATSLGTCQTSLSVRQPANNSDS